MIMIRIIVIVRNDDESDDQEYGWMDGWMFVYIDDTES